MKGLTALVFGSSGLVGGALVKLLIADGRYESILLFNRTPGSYRSKKVKEIITDFKVLEPLEKHLKKADVCFYCIGTTIKDAGTQDKFREIDYGITIKIASLCNNYNVPHFVYISSIGANHKSGNFYLRVKGEVELALQQMGFKTLSIVRPSMLLGKRKESRFKETFGKIVMTIFYPFIFLFAPNSRPIKAAKVAYAMKRIVRKAKASGLYSSSDLKKICSDKYNFN